MLLMVPLFAKDLLYQSKLGKQCDQWVQDFNQAHSFQKGQCKRKLNGWSLTYTTCKHANTCLPRVPCVQTETVDPTSLKLLMAELQKRIEGAAGLIRATGICTKSGRRHYHKTDTGHHAWSRVAEIEIHGLQQPRQRATPLSPKRPSEESGNNFSPHNIGTHIWNSPARPYAAT
ncbi:hypothetical protein M407DRAFT_30242 [Tulasnella calospora MUT 4182]|uniref:Uncharacterized protein n=1 Tax=Tulasnella calospora MUT 4182 TaxID=1051891 RepID=A0A0C3PY26_9AGAM|nr:hypothetical protein M407DRAFT_30242 [Tulasnella calospora MUT 4182]